MIYQKIKNNKKINKKTVRRPRSHSINVKIIITKMLKKEGLQDFEMDEIKSVAEHIRQHSANSVEKQNLKAEQTAKKQANKTAQKSMKQQAQNNLIIAMKSRNSFFRFI